MVLLALSVCSRIIDKFCFSNALSLLVSQLQSFYSSAFSSLPIRRLAYILQHQYERITLQSLPAFAQSWQPAHRLSALSLQHPSLALTATYNSAQFQFTAQLGQIGLQCQSQASVQQHRSTHISQPLHHKAVQLSAASPHGHISSTWLAVS